MKNGLSAMKYKSFIAASLLLADCSAYSSVFNYEHLSNSLSFLFGGEQDFRATDHSTYLTFGLELNNLFTMSNKNYVEIDNRLIYGPNGSYYILNPYSIPGKYPSDDFNYYGRVTFGHSFQLNGTNTLAVGLGGGYRFLRYSANYDQPQNTNRRIVSNISKVKFLYNEFYVPLEANYNSVFTKDISVSFNNIVPIGIRGLANHKFTGPHGFERLSYHDSIGYFPTVLLNYKQFSFGPWASYTVFTRGRFHGVYTVEPGVILKIVEFGIKASYSA